MTTTRHKYIFRNTSVYHSSDGRNYTTNLTVPFTINAPTHHARMIILEEIAHAIVDFAQRQRRRHHP